MPLEPFRRALITGASSGIGRSFAEHLAKQGCDLVLVARDAARLRELAKQLEKAHGISARVLSKDLCRSEERARVEAEIGGDPELDLLVNNAGFGTLGRFAELDLEREVEEIELNVTAVVRLTRVALPGMIARGRGAIINVASLAAFQPGPYNATYAATKSYLKSFTESLSEELRGSGVRVQVLCPGFTRTDFQRRAGLDSSRIPSFAWLTAEQVVEESLQALHRDKVVCIPGLAYRMTATVAGLTPDTVLRRVVGVLARRTIV